MTISDDTDMASELNNFFCTDFSLENVSSISVCDPVSNISDIPDIYISPDLVNTNLTNCNQALLKDLTVSLPAFKEISAMY